MQSVPRRRHPPPTTRRRCRRRCSSSGPHAMAAYSQSPAPAREPGVSLLFTPTTKAGDGKGPAPGGCWPGGKAAAVVRRSGGLWACRGGGSLQPGSRVRPTCCMRAVAGAPSHPPPLNHLPAGDFRSFSGLGGRTPASAGQGFGRAAAAGGHPTPSSRRRSLTPASSRQMDTPPPPPVDSLMDSPGGMGPGPSAWGQADGGEAAHLGGEDGARRTVM